jgi:rhodanese-related sulfurtransferase/DNA-binding transcriptional ArsR family regulator
MAEFREEPIYRQLARIGKTLASPVRLRLLDVLDQRERTVEQLSEAAGIPLKNTSAQLQQLRAAHLVTSRKDGTRVYYRLADERVSRFLGELQDFAGERLADLREAVSEHLGDPAVLEPVTAGELAARLADPESGVVIVDVRSAADHARGHVPGAVSVPLAELRDRLDELPRDAEIVAYCGGPYCAVSPEAVRLLRERGFRARPLDGGLARWRRAGNRLQADPDPVAL